MAGHRAGSAPSRASWLLPEATLMSESPDHLNVSQQKDVAIVEFTQNKILDEMNINEIGSSLIALIEAKDRPKLLLDFANVDHLSSAALGMLITVNNKVKQQNGQLRLASIKPQIMEVFIVTKLNRLFKIAPARAEAMDSFG
jgi:anti-sigma B factor antagonist